MSRRTIAAVLVALLVAGCREDDGFIGGPGGARAAVSSDPQGGRILVDGRETGRFTPDTISGLTGRRDVSVRLDTLDISYRYTAELVLTNPDTVADVNGPLVVRCATMVCFRDLYTHYAANRVRFATNPNGALFFADASGEGLIWPSVSNNSYASGGFPVFSALTGGDSIALGVYDTDYLAGRPLPEIAADEEHVSVKQTTWVVPPANLLARATIRGIRIDEHVTATRSVDDVVLVRLVFHNITAEPLYQLVDPFVPSGGITLLSAYVGFALDPDIGTSTDDLLSYDLESSMAFAYDARFEEGDFGDGFNRRPGLVGLQMVEAPANANVILNGWSRQTGLGDWSAGDASEGTGWGMMSGRRVYAPDHVNPRIGHTPTSEGDVRLMVSAGPVALAPGDSAAITVAILMAEPAQGTFNSGTEVAPGNPTDTSRLLYRIAAPLLERARAVAAAARPR
jgi:hypothetical protein